MMNQHFIPPPHNELEVSIFGPGYGESILLHIGAGNWLLIDSCLDPISKRPAALKYLDELNIDVAQAVKLVVATHWHDDHIRGLGAAFEACSSARFVLSEALRSEDFLMLASLAQQPTPLQSSGIDEFARIFKLVTARRIPPNALKWAISDRLLFTVEVPLAAEPASVKVFALSPSDAAVLQAKQSFGNALVGETQQRTRIVSLQPNYTSVVLWVEVGRHKILLGADLENTLYPCTGWAAIVYDSLVATAKAQVFKIPHHGSENAHHQDVWCRLLLRDPYAILTPFNRGKNPPPSPADVQRIVHLTSNAYITSPTKQQKLKWRERSVRECVEQATRRIYTPSSGWGQVRLRRAIEEDDAAWRVEMFGDACSLEGNSL